MSYLVLHVRPWDFTSEEGVHLQGATVTYLDLSSPSEEGEIGHAPLNLSVDPELVPSFSQAPALYNLDFRQRRGKGGKPRIVLVGATVERGVNLGKPNNPTA